MAELFRVVDLWGRSIVLTEERWHVHIVAQHPDFAREPSIVADALLDPAIVTYDRAHPDRELFYGVSPLPYPLGNRFVRVVVGFGATAGFVITAHLIKEPHREKKRKWP